MAAGWMMAANGILAGEPGRAWVPMGDYRYTINDILRQRDGALVVASGNGLWRVPEDRDGMWVQMHDETLTEVSVVIQTEAGLVAGSPYGVAVSREDEAGVPRWTSLTEHLRVNARFTNAIVVDSQDSGRRLVGTEGGVIVGRENGKVWEETLLNDTPVRSIVRRAGGWLAGSDSRGLLASDDGIAWTEAGVEGAVFCVTIAGDRVVMGTDRGLVVQSEAGHRRVGPRALIRCLAVDPEDEDVWVAGADPGGLWWSTDAGASWQNTSVAQRIRRIVVPEGGVS